jgi:hypothetical protein
MARDDPQMSSSTDQSQIFGSRARGTPLMPRVLRLRDAPRYLGMNRNLFNAEVRPCVTEVRIGRQGIAFDRLELDAWWEHYQSRNGRPAARRIEPWDERTNGYAASSIGAVSGTSTRESEVAAFAKALANTTSAKRRSI